MPFGYIEPEQFSSILGHVGSGAETQEPGPVFQGYLFAALDENLRQGQVFKGFCYKCRHLCIGDAADLGHGLAYHTGLGH
jgi:hypothetical protein